MFPHVKRVQLITNLFSQLRYDNYEAFSYEDLVCNSNPVFFLTRPENHVNI